MAIFLIIVGLVAIWFGSAWGVLRIGAANGNAISVDVLDAAVMVGPFGFGILLWARNEQQVNRVYRRVRRWFA